jgi:hypothetical protein
MVLRWFELCPVWPDVRQGRDSAPRLGWPQHSPGDSRGLPDDFTVERVDIPADPERGEPGRCLPPEIMTLLCANLDTLEPTEVRVATQIPDTSCGLASEAAIHVLCLSFRASQGGCA